MPAMERGTTIHSLAEHYLLGNITGGVPKQLQKLTYEFKGLKKAKPTCEKFWGVDDNWKPKEYPAWCVAKLDSYVPPSKKENVLIEVDHKTGRVYPEHVDQASLYSAIGFGYYPKVDLIEVEFFYIDQGFVQPYEFTRAKLKYNVKYWLDQGKFLMSRKKFPATPSRRACDWCGFRSDKKLANGQPGPCDEYKVVWRA